MTPCHPSYDIALEPVLCCIRQRVSGLGVPPSPFKLSAFADDVVVGVQDQEDEEKLVEALGLHEKACNAKLNYGKSETLRLGNTTEEEIHGIGKIIEADGTFKHLGITFHARALPLPAFFYNDTLETL